MYLYADLYNADGITRVGRGPVALARAEITRGLDTIGRITLTAAGTDVRALELLTNERRARIFAVDHTGSVRALGGGVIRNVRAQGSAAAWWRIAEGADELDALMRVNTLLGRTYSQQTPSYIASSLTALVSGWSASGSGGTITDARFDGMSVWRALISLADAQGLHIRAGSTPNTAEIGAFGALAGVRLVGASALHDQTALNSATALIERIEIEQSSAAAATRLYPVGAGIGEALLTLANSTRTAPYAIQSVTGANGVPQYYLQDAAGVSTFGVIERFGKFKQIAPLSNSPADLEHATNALYDVAAAWLTRYAVRQDTIRVSVRGVTTAIRPGDKVHVLYRGVVEQDGAIVDYLDIDADLWVMRVTERVDATGVAADLTLSSVDRHPEDASPLQIGGLEAITIDGLSVTSYFNRVAYVYDRLIDPSHPALIPVRLTNATQKLSRCTLKIKTRPFTATATAATGGGLVGLGTNTAGAHRHSVGADGSGASGAYYWRDITIYDAVRAANAHVLLPIDSETGDLDLQTGAAGDHAHVFSVPDHTHALTYGLQQDSVTPINVRLFVDGVDITTGVGGAWAGSGGATTFEVDITTAVLAGGALQSEHEVKLTCSGGRGSVEVSVEIYEVIAAIAL